MLDDGLGSTQSIATDTKHDRVARPKHSTGVGEHVGSTLEHEAHNAETGSHLFDPPTLMINRLDDLAATGGLVGPTTKTRDHVCAHLVGQFEPGRTAPTVPGRDDVGLIGRSDRCERVVICLLYTSDAADE